MNPELPKPMFDALAREKAPVEHPSADALAAFVERTLAGEENRRITEHLARCGECRETVFLASNAAEEAEVEERELVAAASAQIKLQPATKATRGWPRRLVWAMPVAAVVLLAAGVLIRQQGRRTLAGPEVASRAESKGEERPPVAASPVTTGQPSGERVMASPPAKPVPKTSPANSTPPKTPRTVGEGPSSAVADAMGVEAPVTSAAPNAKDEAAKIAIAGAAAPAPAVQPALREFAAAPSKRAGVAYSPPATRSLHLSPQAPNPGAETPSHHEWRVTPEGHLEQLTASGWSRVLATEAARFRAVAVIGNEVWAGGTGGALFHSSDGGQEWKAVSLGGGESGTITSIQFDEAKHGVVATEDGKRWSTTDGGATWARL